jgi:hypothetical protein
MRAIYTNVTAAIVRAREACFSTPTRCFRRVVASHRASNARQPTSRVRGAVADACSRFEAFRSTRASSAREERSDRECGKADERDGERHRQEIRGSCAARTPRSFATATCLVSSSARNSSRSRSSDQYSDAATAARSPNNTARFRNGSSGASRSDRALEFVAITERFLMCA